MLTQLKGVGESLKKKLNLLGIYTINDLLLFLPSTYIDFDVGFCEESEDGDFCKAVGFVEKKYNFSKGGLKLFRTFCGCGEMSFNAVWFNQPYVSRNIEKGGEYTFFGKIKRVGKTFEFINPQFEQKNAESKFSGISPVYPLKKSIAQGTFRSIMSRALERRNEFPCVISPIDEKEFSLLPLADAIYQIHSPKPKTDISSAIYRLNLENAVRRLAAFKLERTSIPRNRNFLYNKDWSGIEDAERSLPYILTDAQKYVLDELKNKLVSKEFFNAILCGDVGSGKTVIALLVSHFVAENGRQIALMAPTEILAKQHYETALKLFAGGTLKPILITASMKAKKRQRAEERIRDGEVNLIIGTHALLSNSVEYKSLSLVIIDEQHRFGVAQRTKLIKKGDTDILTLSATPIPRSLQLILYGDIEYFTLEKRFSGNISTKIVDDSKLGAMVEFICSQCANGQQSFIVLPKIEDEEGCDIYSAEGVYKEITDKFPRVSTALLHGRMKDSEKISVMDKFSSGETSLLVSTTVVEVGIDVPDASIMAVLNVERMGLSALHQLRGRVGRNGQKAFCFLHTTDVNNPRLKKIAECSDGFSLAEFDYELRGGGNVFGKNQAGKEGLAGLTPELIARAKTLADRVDLSSVGNVLKEELFRFDLAEISLT